VASAGPYASLSLLQTDNHANTHHSVFFTGWVPFLPPNQQHQSTEGTHTHTHTHTRLTALCLGLPMWNGTRKVKPIWILVKQETVSGSGISWAACKSAHCSRQITTPAPHHSVFYRPDALPAAQPTVSKHWRHKRNKITNLCRLWHYMLSNSRSTAVEMLVSADVHCRMCHIPGQRSRLHWFQAGRFTTSQGIQFVLTFAVKELTQKN